MKKGKWLIIIGIIVVLAVVLTIVFINLFTPKHTTELANQLNSVTQTGYLDKENANNKNIQEFLGKINTNKNLDKKEQVQIENYLNALQAFSEMGEFYNRQMIFTTHTKAYSDNADSIIKSLKEANSIAAGLGSYFETNMNRDEQLQAEAWRTKTKQMKSLFDNSYNAFIKLSAVYTSCVTSKIKNNEMSKAVFKVTNYLLAGIKTDLENKDVPSQINGPEFLNFVKMYYPKEKNYLIYNSVYNESAIEIAKEINEAKDLADYKAVNGSNWQKFLGGNVLSATALSFDLEVAA